MGVLARLGFGLVVAIAACGAPPEEATSRPRDRRPTPVATEPREGAAPRGPRPSETPEVPVIFVASRDGRLLAFDPVDRVFVEIGPMACPTRATAHSMSVDRSNRAWVLFSDGQMFWVDTADASCRESSWTPGDQGFYRFGMGFVRDPDGGDALYISSDDWLGRVDPATGRATIVGQLPGGETDPELAGGDADALFAYYPGVARSYVARLDRHTGAAVETWPLPVLPGHATAWAAASLGGRLHVFVTAADEQGVPRSRVYRFDPGRADLALIVPGAPYAIVGAGVGTRPPVVVR